ncbi:MAG: DUF1289 domain-containing protein [Proteobacteria bacterium]|nr:DUF1289 domain-containing protein [Pseudomonadota bacterium]
MSKSKDATEDRDTRPPSPCTLICKLDGYRRCLGCGRTLEQISRWALMSSAEQWAVIDELRAREAPD